MHLLKAAVIFFLLIEGYLPVSAQLKINVVLEEATPVTNSRFYKTPANTFIQYTGRIERNLPYPRFWSPGVYIRARFTGSLCEVFLNDEVLYGNSHNYIELVIDDTLEVRLKTKWKYNKIKVEGLEAGNHTILVCKNTEAGIGYLEFAGINCNKLLKLPAKSTKKIEFIGNSITCGLGMDLSEFACNDGQWYDQHNAWLSYGPLTARKLNAQWYLSAVSGIGLIHSCCNMTITMPQVFDKINMRNDSIPWNFDLYTPDIVTICLGQNDGIQDSATFCTAYVSFINSVRTRYKNADIICLTSPMGDSVLTTVLKNYLTSIVRHFSAKDRNIHAYFFTRQYHNGCGGHPNLVEHQEIAVELAGYIKRLKHW